MPNKENQHMVLQCYRCRGYGHRQSGSLTIVNPGMDQKGSTPVSQGNQKKKKTRAMVAKSSEDAEEGCIC